MEGVLDLHTRRGGQTLRRQKCRKKNHSRFESTDLLGFDIERYVDYFKHVTPMRFQEQKNTYVQRANTTTLQELQNFVGARKQAEAEAVRKAEDEYQKLKERFKELTSR